jgi:hypothetical protein
VALVVAAADDHVDEHVEERDLMALLQALLANLSEDHSRPRLGDCV